MNKLYYFNPGHEGAILSSSPYYMSPSNVVTMQNDLAYLSAWYADPSDFVWLQTPLPREFKEYLLTNLCPLAEGLTEDKIGQNGKMSEVHLWGVSPQAINYFEKLNEKCDTNLKLPAWRRELRQLSSRETAKECLTYLCNHIPSVSSDIVPQFYNRLEDVECVVENSEDRFLAKAPYSSSGRGLLWLPIGGITQTERQILQGILNKQKVVSVEKALDKKLDFAMEFILSKETISFEGFSLFETNNKGGYMGNFIGNQRAIVDEIEALISLNWIEEVKICLTEFLKCNYQPFYTGCIGVDMMIYNSSEGYKLHPCVEINVRDNMGLLALRLSQNYLDIDSTGTFKIDFNTIEGEQLKKDTEMKTQYPPLFLAGKLQSGYLSLCPVNERTKYRAYVLVEQ